MNFYMLAKIAPSADLSSTQTIGVIISGLVVVFLVLLLLVGFVRLFSSFFEKGKKDSPKKQTAPPEPETKKIALQPPAPEITLSPDDDPDEIIAVISAVVAQMSAQDGKQYKIKSVKAKNSKTAGRPLWASEGLRQNTAPF